MKNILFVFTVGVLFYSCEKVIELPLKTAESKLVIEANIDDFQQEQIVKLSMSTPFDEEIGQKLVSGAQVNVFSSNGRKVHFKEEKPGHYVARKFKGTSGRTYRLEVLHDEEKYEATATMPSKITVDSIGFSESTFMDRSLRTINILFQDPPGESNFYRFIVRPGNENTSYTFIYNDKFNDGKKVVYNLSTIDMELRPQDSLSLDVMTVDESMYVYWKGVQDQNPGNANPANPINNISNGALGYFSTHTKKKIKLLVE